MLRGQWLAGNETVNKQIVYLTRVPYQLAEVSAELVPTVCGGGQDHFLSDLQAPTRAAFLHAQSTSPTGVSTVMRVAVTLPTMWTRRFPETSY